MYVNKWNDYSVRNDSHYVGPAGDLGRNNCSDKSSGVSSRTVRDGADATFSGAVFHSRKAATIKAQSPMVERRVRRTTSDDDETERRR